MYTPTPTTLRCAELWRIYRATLSSADFWTWKAACAVADPGSDEDDCPDHGPTSGGCDKC